MLKFVMIFSFGSCIIVPFKEKYALEWALVVVGRRFPYKKLVDKQ